MSSVSDRWVALLQIAPPEGADPYVDEFWDEALDQVRKLIQALPEKPERSLGQAMNAFASGVEECLREGEPWDAKEQALIAMTALRAGLSGTVAGRYRAALQELERLHQCWWDGFGGGCEELGADQLARIPCQAASASSVGLPIKQRKELRQLLLPRLQRFLERSHQRAMDHSELMQRIRDARTDEVMARRKLGLPEQGPITLVELETALAAVAAGEPEAHPNRKRRWQQAAENLRLLIRVEQRDQE